MSITFKGTDMSVPISFIGMYSDATPMVKTDQWDKIVRCDTLVLRATSMQEFVVGMFLVDSVTHQGGNIRNLILPYLPGARQDRVNPTGDVLFTAKSVAMMINQRRFARVVTVDPHSNVMPLFINDFEEYSLERLYGKLWKGYEGIICPDKGAQFRAIIASDVLNLPVAFASKTRDVSTGKLTGFEVPTLRPGAHYVVIDDICDGGGTFVGLGEKIREQGSYADLFVTHGIFSKGTSALKEIYKTIYTTDTFRGLRDDLDVIRFNVVEEMENYNV